MPIPTILTPRLRLRPMRREDWPAYRAMMESPRACFMGGPFGLPAAWGMFCADYALWDLFGTGALMIDDRQSGETLGQVAVNQSPLFPEPELGWMLYPSGEGRGAAFEAAAALRDWAQRERGLRGLVSYIDRGNQRSIRLAERLGARLDPHAPRPDPEDLVYRHP